MATQVLSRRLTRGKAAKQLRPKRQKKSRGHSRPRRRCLDRGAPARAGRAALPGGSNHRAAASAERSESHAPGAEAVISQTNQDSIDPTQAPTEQAPEVSELERKRSELSAIESELDSQERVLARLQAEMLPFEALYFRKLGIRFARLDEIEARIAEIHAKARPEDGEAQAAAHRARDRANRSRRAIPTRRRKGKFNPPLPLKRLYRSVARRVHPDLGETIADCQVRERLMAHANRAYRAGDERRLLAVIREYEFCPEVVKGEGTPADLVRVIRKIAQSRTRLEEIREEMDRVHGSDLYQFKQAVEAREKQGKDFLAEVVAKVNTRISFALLRLQNLRAAVRQGLAEDHGI